MALKATEHAIAALKPTEKSYERVVDGHRGLIVRVHPSGEKVFMYRWKQDGILKRITLDAGTLADARAEYLKQRAAVKRGDDPIILIRQQRFERKLQRKTDYFALTFSQLADDYVRLYAKVKKRSWEDDVSLLNQYAIPAWGRIPAREILRQDVNRLLDTVAMRAPIRANRLLSCLRKLFNWAMSRDLLPTSPCLGVQPPSVERPRDRVLSDQEITVFWNGLLSTSLSLLEQSALRLQLLTGTRIGEVAGATWSEFDIEKGVWIIPAARTKNGRELCLPLPTTALQLIKNLPRNTNYLFPIRRGGTGHIRVDSLGKHLSQNMAVFGVSAPFRTHDLRRTMATNLAELGISRTVIDAVLNHTEQGVIAIYDRHSYFAEKRQALEAWAERLSQIVGNP